MDTHVGRADVFHIDYRLGVYNTDGLPLIAVCAVDTVAIWIFSKMSSRETIPRTAEWELMTLPNHMLIHD